MATHHEPKKLIITKSTLSRLPIYYQYLLRKYRLNEKYVSSTEMAESLAFNPVQVRKDLASVSSRSGRPKLGFNTKQLFEDIRCHLGFDHDDYAIIVGAGRLGSALAHYTGFDHCGVHFLAAFDVKPELVGTEVAGKPVLDVAELERFVLRNKVKIAVLTLPCDQAQAMAQRLVDAGVRALWNFTPSFVHVPDGVIIKNESMASSLAILAREMNNNA